MLGKDYTDKIFECMNLVKEHQWGKLEEVAALIARSIASGGILHIFGCGHSHLLAEEAFYRAGGLVPVNPIFDTSIMLHEGAVKSSRVERMQGYAQLVLDNYAVNEGEVLTVFSNSGINPLPIEMALEAHKKGLKVVSVSSLSYEQALSRHPSGYRLCDISDISIDNHIPKGDALVAVPGTDYRIAPGSTTIGSFILNIIISEVVDELLRMKIVPPFLLAATSRAALNATRSISRCTGPRSRICKSGVRVRTSNLTGGWEFGSGVDADARWRIIVGHRPRDYIGKMHSDGYGGQYRRFLLTSLPNIYEQAGLG